MWWQTQWGETVQEAQDIILGTLKQCCQSSDSPGPAINVFCLAVSLIHDLYLLIHMKWLINDTE